MRFDTMIQAKLLFMLRRFGGSGSCLGTERRHPENLYSVSQPAFSATIRVSIPVATYRVRCDGFEDHFRSALGTLRGIPGEGNFFACLRHFHASFDAARVPLN